MSKTLTEPFPPSNKQFNFDNLQFTIRHFPLKRLFDIIFSISVLVLLLPLYLIIGIFIRISSRGNAIYFHERIGRGGTIFRCYKFRTMYSDADKRLKEILAKDFSKRQEWALNRKLKNDPRVTPLGRFLRKTSLDELPQFWNVARGDLSTVGPRPVTQEEIDIYYGVKAVKILSIRPGITGLWQVSGRSDTTYITRVNLDEQYVNSHSFMLDILLILKTVTTIFSSKGAY